jgi:hypothetical protein
VLSGYFHRGERNTTSFSYSRGTVLDLVAQLGGGRWLKCLRPGLWDALQRDVVMCCEMLGEVTFFLLAHSYHLAPTSTAVIVKDEHVSQDLYMSVCEDLS